MIPDLERLVGGYLRDHELVTVLGARVASQMPANPAYPWVKITQLDAANQPESSADHYIGYLLQLDCYAGRDGGQGEASLLARSVRAALHELRSSTLDGQAVVGAVRFLGMLRLPDTDLEPARERYVLTAQVSAHSTYTS